MSELLWRAVFCGGFAVSVLATSAQETIYLHMEESGTGLVCRMGSRLFDYAGCTNFFGTSERYDGKPTIVFMGVEPNVKANHVMGVLASLRNSGFKQVILDCNMEDDSGNRAEPWNPWEELPMWFFAPGNLGRTPAADTFDASELGLVSFNTWEKTYMLSTPKPQKESPDATPQTL